MEVTCCSKFEPCVNSADAGEFGNNDSKEVCILLLLGIPVPLCEVEIWLDDLGYPPFCCEFDGEFYIKS